jgi:protein-S-isoprenylcysteine O-methyltransferase Ste14
VLTGISRFALIFVIGALIVLAATGNLVSLSPFAIAAQVLAVGLAVWARRSFPAGAFRVSAGPGGNSVIRRGPYRLIRHPMYAGALLFLWAAVLSHLSLWTGVVGLVTTTIVAIRIGIEERVLRERYTDYDTYAQATKAVVPYLL